MKRFSRQWLNLRVACGLLAFAGGLGSCAGARAHEYRFSPVNQYGMTLTADYWMPIIKYVSQRSGVKLELKMGRTASDTTAYVKNHEVDFVFSNHLFSPERERLGWRVFARRNLPKVYGELVVPEESPIKDVHDLEGESVAFSSSEALIAFKFPYAHLLVQKVDVKPVFTGNGDSALAQMFGGKVQAAGVNSQLAETYAQREHHRYRVLWRSEPVYDLALMASPRVPEKTLKAVAQAFTDMHRERRGREILAEASRSVGLDEETNFIPSNGTEYAAYRRFYDWAPAQLR